MIPQAKGAPLGVVKKDPESFADVAKALSTVHGFMGGLASYEEDTLQFEDYQLAFLNNPSPYRGVEKSRQTGFSFVFAVEGLGRSHLKPQHNSIFVSYNLADAKEKIAYCKAMYESLPLEYQKKLVIDSKLELGFESHNGHRKTVSRISSNPSKAPRGRNGDIYLDELAHCQNDREIYKGSTALILRKGGQLTVCSSPLGKRGVFWEILREEIKPYSTYTRQHVPWWLCRHFCTNIEDAALYAPHLETEHRVELWGNERIKQQYEALTLEDFQQEFEVFYSDEAMTFFPYGLILNRCTMDPEDLVDDFSDLVNCRGRLVAGFDVGRNKDLSVLAIFEIMRDGLHKCRMIRTYEKMPFEDQENELKAMLTIAEVARLSIDKTGLGIQLAENLEKEFPGQVIGEVFSEAKKEVWSNDFKILLQRELIELPRDRLLIGDIHSIRKIQTSNRTLFVSGRDKNGHADRYWACALATQKDRQDPARLPAGISVTMIG